ncbi:MAG: Uma2 family endonuclease [Planctomycetes bacterium]|nr:Uma2 family endonuclease [Planctomycetota bacterium]
MGQSTLDRSGSLARRLARITVEQYHKMLRAEVFRDGEPIELLEGVLVAKDRSARGEEAKTVNPRHAAAVTLLSELGARLAASNRHLRTEKPLTLQAANEPEPDGAVVRGKPRDYAQRHPGAAEACCVLEVADSSLEHDRTVKARIYAGAGIPQYLLVNLVDDVLEVFEEVHASEGRYARAIVLRRGELLSLDCGDGSRVDVQVDDFTP